jgi:hypothetical protein
MLCCIREFTSRCNGIIFGGFVRDMIIHDHFAQAYYEYADRKEELLDQYSNKDHHPESWPMRTHQPEDIDIALTTENYNEFKKLLETNGYKFKVKHNDLTHPYRVHLANHDMKIDTLTVSVKVHHLLASYTNITQTMPSIKIDVIFKDSFDPVKDRFPIGKVDFECNALVIKNGSIDLQGLNNYQKDPFNKLRKINDIVDDIIKFRAIPINPEEHRIDKMISKGFHIVDRFIEILPSKEVDKYEGQCITCCSKFKKHDIVLKNRCCDGHYHLACYKDICSNARNKYDNIHYCVMCRALNTHSATTPTTFERFVRVPFVCVD